MNSLDFQISALGSIIEHEDLKNYAGDSFWELISSVIFSDPVSTLKVAKNIKDLVFNMPTLIFWDKMRRFLTGTFHCYDDQMKMAAKFNKDNPKYNIFVKRLVQVINEINDDNKVDYFANLTRCFLITELDEELYFKLANVLVRLTSYELEFIRSKPSSFSAPNDAYISLLYQESLFTQKEDYDGRFVYCFSDLAIALKQNSLNYNDGLQGQSRLLSYSTLTPQNITEPVSFTALENLTHDTPIIFDCGHA